MPNISITVKNKVARADKVIIVCGNSDYVAHFDFDSEWDEYAAKTAHFEWGGKYEDVVFTGNECSVPVVYGVNALTIGVFAGDIRSTTPAFFKCVPCSQDSNSIPADPTPDVYNQIMELLNKESGIWYPAVDDAGNMSWTRSMSETEPQPVNIKGPKGDAGADGIGIPGADGKDGVDGKSAYELAQDNGFAGTMQEWLASLVGADGANGVDGKDGISPAVSVAAITGGNRITITDAEGAKTFDVMDGAQGASGADGKDYVLTDADKQEIAEAAAGFVDVPSVQPDWNQNNSTQPDYVKNRPFYTGNPVETVLVEESTVSFANQGGRYIAQFPSTFSATVGETYKVSWDGTTYECACVDFNGYLTIGNLSIAGAASDTGEPFLMLVSNGSGIVIYTADTSASHTFSISVFVPKVVEIDRKYLPTAFKPEGESYLTFSSPSIFTLKVNDANKHWDGTIEYFASDSTWVAWNGGITLSAVYNYGEYVLYLRGTGNTTIVDGYNEYKWVITGSDIACNGNIENLLDCATVESGEYPTMADSCYYSMFEGCTALTKAPELPATTLTTGCYTGMFSGCTSLTQAPALPATTLAGGCYTDMFRDCTSLTQAPALPATTLARNCYYGMFNGCTALTKVPELPATTLAERCYSGMFNGCTSLKLSTTQTGEYTQEYRIPMTGTGTTATNALTDMFISTGGTFTGTPEIDTTYYLSTDNMIVRDTEIATLNGYVGSMIDVAIGEYADTAEYIIPSSTSGSTKKFKITVDDSGSPTIKDESDSTNTWKPTNLPTVTASDAGKFLRVSDTGEWVADTIPNASGVNF